MKKKAILSGTCAILFLGVLSACLGSNQEISDVYAQENTTSVVTTGVGVTALPTEEQPVKAVTVSGSKTEEYIEVDTDADSYTVLVNRDYPIDKDYEPEDLVVPNVAFSFSGTCEKSYMRERAAAALEDLFAGAKENGYTLKAVSAYRSYARQLQIYSNNLKTEGEELANQVSAPPGTSEHQTGLAVDVSCSSVGCALETSFADTPEGKWLKKNCYKYGFIIRYPKEKTDITGYAYEPWHIRYVGKNLAKYLHKNNLTLEEYYSQTTVENQVPPDEEIYTDTVVRHRYGEEFVEEFAKKDAQEPDATQEDVAETKEQSESAVPATEDEEKKEKQKKVRDTAKKESKNTEETRSEESGPQAETGEENTEPESPGEVDPEAETVPLAPSEQEEP